VRERGRVMVTFLIKEPLTSILSPESGGRGGMELEMAVAFRRTISTRYHS
jgi:hypothetical protein